ncbi:methyl-accepting chemotaxis protein [Alkalihalobacillus hemicellulosilyticus]|uniref:Methyl-accepting chemotaxis protein n=1 Tax=Halalkalibacter hemicellulosilyticusJCM 9152 TaxID=1236971 RepID=W4QBU9_9BACI|nr:methyl-accepting chemotaxis protein [Halalkalibacter hemicellulosilyticus]GAE28869.1 methyl-accepting chemotaxis protein [Halalkalibacter hemicellulosilyticusJCM 9152]
MKKLRSIKVKMFLFMSLLLLIPLLIVGILSYQKTNVLERAVIEKDDLEEVNSEFSDIFKEYESLLTDISNMEEMQVPTIEVDSENEGHHANLPNSNDPSKTIFYEQLLSEISLEHPFLINLYVGTELGEMYLDNIPSEDVDLSQYDPRERDWYIDAIVNSGSIIWTEPYIDTASGQSTITLANTIRDSSGTVIGVAGMDFDMSQLATMIRHDILRSTIITTVVAIMIGLACMVFFLNRFVSTITRVNEQMGKIAEGDLTGEKLASNGNDELAELSQSVNNMQSDLTLIVDGVKGATNHVDTQSKQLTQFAVEVKEGSEQIAATIEELSSGVERQASSATDVVERMSQFNQDIHEATKDGEEVTHHSHIVRKLTEEGSLYMSRTVEQMKQIDRVVSDAVKKVRGLDEKSQEISTLVQVIKDVSEQTNLLALNAAIEAARAGEQGKGFAVVADEVRKLAEQVTGSVEDITSIVSTVQLESNDVARALEDGYQTVNEGTTEIERTNGTFKQMNESITQMVAKMEAIAEKLHLLTENSNEVGTFIEDIAAISEQSAAGIEEVSASAEQSSGAMEEVTRSADELAKLANDLKEQMNRFKL